MCEEQTIDGQSNTTAAKPDFGTKTRLLKGCK